MQTEEIIDAVRDFLDEDDWRYEFESEKTLIRFGVSLNCKLKDVRCVVDFGDDYYIVYAISPINADKETPQEMLKYLSMANYGLRNGNFELDVRDGEIRYKCYVNCDGIEALSKSIIEDSIKIPCAMFDRYGNGIAALAMGFSDAETEIKKAEPDNS
ncbi:MAG: hypothetical protein J6334_09050 [Kiritimatiellae bacterium]|nr:hypothetical protein [Kiritimatiellia bacterium]